MQILVVEDDASIRDMLYECLTDEGHDVVAARQGQEALRLLGAGGRLPDLILLDLAMPVMDGWAFLDVQQEDERLRAVRVIVFSADRSVGQPLHLPRGVAAVGKPIDLDTLLRAIDGVNGG